MNKIHYLLYLGVIACIGFILLYLNKQRQMVKMTGQPVTVSQKQQQNNEDPLAISTMRKKAYPGSELTIEQTLVNGTNYRQYIASYTSEGLKIYGLLTVPIGISPASGWPVIIFNHGYIPPATYKTTERYVAYVDAFARNGYIVFKPDYRGNGNSEGTPEGAYYSPAYATDVLNALSSIKRYKEADPTNVGMWGHSMGGNITLRDIVVDTKSIKAAVIWGGVVGSYEDILNNWQRRVRYQPPPQELALRNRHRSNLTDTHGTPSTNPEFWNSIDPVFFLGDITTPIQLHTGGADEEVPVDFSVHLKDMLEKQGKIVEYYTYESDDHNISRNLSIALQRSVQFFDKYLKEVKKSEK